LIGLVLEIMFLIVMWLCCFSTTISACVIAGSCGQTQTSRAFQIWKVKPAHEVHQHHHAQWVDKVVNNAMQKKFTFLQSIS
jgi:hypothetical protein